MQVDFELGNLHGLFAPQTILWFSWESQETAPSKIEHH